MSVEAAADTLKGKNIRIWNCVKYSDANLVWKLHGECSYKGLEQRSWKQLLVYTLFNNEGLSANIQLTQNKVLIRSTSYSYSKR